MCDFKYDIAISLCKEDVEYADKLVKSINPGLNIFFYKDRQQELIAKSGPVEFAEIFKVQSRVVVILSRNEWSQTYYTEIERNAIIDRTSVINEGYNKIMVIPMAFGEIPNWYPSTRIYIDPMRFSCEDIAKFIEFKVTEEGGNVEPITLEKRYNWFHEKLELKKRLIKLQETPKALTSAKVELEKIKSIFNQKIDFLNSTKVSSTSQIKFNESKSSGLFALDQYCLECRCIPANFNISQLKLPQDAMIQIELFEAVNDTRNVIEQEERTFYYSTERIGWAEMSIFKPKHPNDKQLLFGNRANNLMFDLNNPVSSEEIIDLWFQKLFIVATSNLESYL